MQSADSNQNEREESVHAREKAGADSCAQTLALAGRFGVNARKVGGVVLGDIRALW